MMTRAKVGGEFGANGEWYEGGKFLNTVAQNPKKCGSAARKARKVQIEPFNWVESTERPILSIVGAGAEYIDRYNWQAGICPFAPAFEGGIMKMNGTPIEEIQALCDRFNNGERFI